MEKKKMGRPPSTDPKNNEFNVRFTDSLNEKIEYCKEKLGKTTSEIFRMGVEELYQKLKK